MGKPPIFENCQRQFRLRTKSKPFGWESRVPRSYSLIFLKHLELCLVFDVIGKVPEGMSSRSLKIASGNLGCEPKANLLDGKATVL
jgi:hypothetical protein